MPNLDSQQFKNIVETFQDGILVTDKNHYITYANPAMANIAGIRAEDIVGVNILNGFREETIGSFRSFYLAAVNSGKPTKYECRVVTPVGRETWQGGCLTPQQEEGKFAGIVCSVQDLSTTNHSKLITQASEARFRELLHSIPSVAVQGYGPDGTTHYWNQASERLYGYSEKEAIGKNLLDLIIPQEIREIVSDEIDQVFATGQAMPSGELSLCRKDGSMVDVFSSHAYIHIPGQTPEMFCVDIDLTELKKAERELRLRESYQRALLDNFPFLVWLKDEKSRFLAANQAFADAFKWPSPESLIGKNDFDIAIPTIAEQYREADQIVMKNGVPSHMEELIGSREPFRWFETYKSPLFVDGKVGGTVGFSREITSRKQDELELLKAKAEAESANRAKSRFLAAASHDLRQPLSALSLYVGLLKPNALPDSLELVENIQNCVLGLSELLTDLLDVSKLEAGVVVPRCSDFAIDDLLGSLVSVNAAKAEQKGLQLRFRQSHLLTFTDYQLLRRILGNLVSNAVRYTDQGGILIACRRHQGKNWVEIWDTGIGIPDDKSSFIFEEFTQLESSNSNKGSGLGLAIVAKMATLLGLQIRFQSRHGRGSMFALELPGSHEAMPEPQQTKPRNRIQLRIALVDDNPQVLSALSLALKNEGHQVVAATNRKDIIKLLGKTAPDILITDYRLSPFENGFDVIQAAKRVFGTVLPALIITGDTDPLIIREMAGRGISVHYKPLSIDSLQNLIMDAMTERAS